MKFIHKPVLLKEVIQFLSIDSDGIYVDGTAGGGGHSEQILRRLNKGLLISIDQDPDAISVVREKFCSYQNSIVVQSNFSQISQVLGDLSIHCVDGVLLDLGVSSYQLDTPERGFSYHHDAPLDMRMSKTGESAYDLVNYRSEHDLSTILWKYGEEKYAKKIARAIVESRDQKQICTTRELADLILSSVPACVRREKKHPARKTFQALRIAVNGEMDRLSEGLLSAFSVLKPGGRLVVITFHSLEDRLVKQQMLEWCGGCTCPPDFPVCICGRVPKAKLINKKPVVPSAKELQENPRSRSAKLRGCIRLE